MTAPELTLDQVRDALRECRTANSFDQSIDKVLFVAYLSAAQGTSTFDIPELLLMFRSEVGSWFERRSICLLMNCLKDNEDVFAQIGDALWSVHKNGCADGIECSLHSLGWMWARGSFGDAETPWLSEAISVLLRDHPLRRWSLGFTSACRRSLDNGNLSIQSVADLFSDAIAAGAHEYWNDTMSLADDWQCFLDQSHGTTREALTKVGNRMLAAGLTSIASSQSQVAFSHLYDEH